MSYYNTTNETNPNLKVYREKTRTQDEICKEVIEELPYKTWSCKDVYKAWPIMNTPITSIRRTINTLKKEGYIKETGTLVPGLFGRNETQYTKS